MNDYVIFVYDYRGDLYDVLDPTWYDEIDWTIRLHEITDLSVNFIGDGAEEASESLKLPKRLNYVLSLNEWRDNRWHEEAWYFLFDDFFRHNQEGVPEYTIIGKSPEILLERKIDSSRSSIGAGGHVIRAGPASEVIAEFAASQVGRRGLIGGERIDQFFTDHDGQGEGVGGRYRYEDLYNEARKLADDGDVQWRWGWDRGRVTFRVGHLGNDYTAENNYPGGDISLVSSLLGNDQGVELKREYSKAQNFAIVRYDTQLGREQAIRMSGLRDDNSPFFHRETVIKPSLNQRDSPSEVVRQGREALDTSRPINGVELNSSAQLVYNEDYRVGDYISVYAAGRYTNFRAEEIVGKLQPGEPVEITPRFVQRDPPRRHNLALARQFAPAVAPAVAPIAPVTPISPSPEPDTEPDPPVESGVFVGVRDQNAQGRQGISLITNYFGRLYQTLTMPTTGLRITRFGVKLAAAIAEQGGSIRVQLIYPGGNTEKQIAFGTLTPTYTWYNFTVSGIDVSSGATVSIFVWHPEHASDNYGYWRRQTSERYSGGGAFKVASLDRDTRLDGDFFAYVEGMPNA